MTDKRPQVKFKGLCMYAQVLPQQARGEHPDKIAQGNAHPDDKSYSIQVECSRELFEKLEDKKIPPATKLKRYEDQPGRTYLNLRGTACKMFTDRDTGEERLGRFPNPILTDKDDNEWDTTKEIGNGSLVEVIANLDKIKGRPGHVLRLHSVKVLDHVPYESKSLEGEVILESDSGATSSQTVEISKTDDNDFF